MFQKNQYKGHDGLFLKIKNKSCCMFIYKWSKFLEMQKLSLCLMWN